VKPPSAILFDWDNTLVDSWGCIQQAMNTTLSVMGHEIWDLTETKRRVALSMKDSFPTLFGDRWQEARDVFYGSFAAIHLTLLQPLPDAEAILGRLVKAGIPLGVVSNKSGPFIRKEVDFLGWGPYFKHLVGAGDSAADKPSAIPAKFALDAMGVAANREVWFIGDAPVDMECAANAGLHALLVRHDEWSDSDFSHHPPAHRFQSWAAFDHFLDEILIP